MDVNRDKAPKAKNLHISIPSSPREDFENKKPKEENKIGGVTSISSQGATIQGNHHSGSQSTTNANAGNIKVNKFTCHSTRHVS